MGIRRFPNGVCIDSTGDSLARMAGKCVCGVEKCFRMKIYVRGMDTNARTSKTNKKCE